MDLATTDLELDFQFNSIQNGYPARVSSNLTRTLVTVFEETVEMYPNFIALEMASDICDGNSTVKKMTYFELNSAANRLARHIVLQGALPDELVAICMEKSALCYISILAIIKAGSGYLPLTPETPVARITQILTDSRVKIFLSTRDIIDTVGKIGGVFMMDVDSTDLTLRNDCNLGLRAQANTLAYAVFTSGSTGIPKGVLVEHEQAVANLDALAKLYPTTAGKRMLQFCNIAFDVAVFEIFFTWHRGMVLCSATKDVLLRDMEAAVNSLRVSHLSMTPTVAALLSPDNVPNVELLVTSGEAITAKVFNDWAGRGLYQGYGPSETTNICTVNVKVQKAHDISNIGPPLENTSAFVVNVDMEGLAFVPRGGVGELCFGGIQVCRGYLNMRELTERKFIVHPHFGRIYRSGDIGRLLPSGEIMFVGRLDDQIKIRGNRVELGEVTSVLLKSRNLIVDSVALLIEEDGISRLIAFIVPIAHTKARVGLVFDEDVQPAIQTLFGNLAASIPNYMIPDFIIPVTTIPMTLQGKTDKNMLQRLFLDLDTGALDLFSSDHVKLGSKGEWTTAEYSVAKVVAEAANLKPETIGKNSSIVKHGLDSISAITLSRKLSQIGLRRLDVSQIMRNPTISEIARLANPKCPVKDKNTGGNVAGAKALEEFENSVRREVVEQLPYMENCISKILPCTPLQEAMLSVKMEANSCNYYNHTLFNINADPARLRDAWIAAAKVHDILRTCFAITSHSKHAYAQVVLKDHQPVWNVYGVSFKEPSKLNSDIENYLTTGFAKMDISRPPYSFGLFHSAEKSVWVMSFHHSLYDGLAMDMLLKNIERLYNSPNIEIPPQPFEFYLQYMESIDLSAAEEFWGQQLEDIHLNAFPNLTGRPSDARVIKNGMKSQRLTCSKNLEQIIDSCKSMSSSMLALGQSTWARLLSAYTGEPDVCFGNVVSGRTVPVDGVESIIAPCFNTLPVRVRITNNSTARSIMENLQEFNEYSLQFQLTPLRRIMTQLRVEGCALFDTLFILQHVREDRPSRLWEKIEDRGDMNVSLPCAIFGQYG
jgi:amino acid adenylation domain-containing protein